MNHDLKIFRHRQSGKIRRIVSDQLIRDIRQQLDLSHDVWEFIEVQTVSMHNPTPDEVTMSGRFGTN